MLKNIERIGYLDGLRGLAAFSVYLFHFVAAFLPFIYFKDISLIHFNVEKLVVGTPLYYLIDGGVMVSIFFVLSGFVLAKVSNNFKDIEDLIPLLLKRYLRLGIPVLVLTLLIFLLFSNGYFHNLEASIITLSKGWLGAFYSFIPALDSALFQGTVGALFLNQSSYNPVLWTIYFELLGSILVISFVVLLKKFRFLKVLILIVISLLLWGSPLLGFILGMLLYEYKYIYLRSISKLTKTIVLLVTIIVWDFTIDGKVTQFFAGKLNFHSNPENIQFFVYSLIASGIIMFVLYSDLIQKLLSRKLFQFLGKISYSFYLLHILIIVSFGSRIFVYLYSYFKGNYAYALTITFILSTILLLLTSFVFTKLIDEKGQILSKKLFQLLIKDKVIK